MSHHYPVYKTLFKRTQKKINSKTPEGKQKGNGSQKDQTS
jgi:hypothetical protein